MYRLYTRAGSGGFVVEAAFALAGVPFERHPYARLAPAVDAPGRADFLRWMAFLTSVTYPALLREYYAHRYTTDASGIEAVQAAAIAEAERSFDVVNAALEGRDWLAGTHMSMVDVYLPMLAYWHPEPAKLAVTWPNIARLCAVLKEHAVLKELNASYDAMW